MPALVPSMSGARCLGVQFSVVAIGAALLLLVGSDASIDLTISKRSPGRPTLAASPNCNAAETRQVVQRFINTFDRGDMKQLDQLFARPDRFLWYSTDAPGQRIDPKARDRDSLIAYFEKRDEEHERLMLKSFSFNGNSASFSNFGFELVRSADDGLPPTPYVGKGAIDCAQTPRTLVVWSMARQPGRSPANSFGVLMGALLVVAVGGGAIAWRRRHR